MTARIRILVLIKGLGIGGAEKLISEGARFWDRERFDYSVAYVLPWKDQLVADLVAQGVEVDMIGGKRGMDFRFPGRLRESISHRGVDLVHAHLPTMGIAARIFSQVPVVYTEHNVIGSYRRSTRLLNRITYGRNSGIISVSQAVADSTSGWQGPNPTVIPNGVSVSFPAEAVAGVRTELGIDDSVKLIVHVGNIRPGKGHEVLIDAVAKLSSERSDFVVASLGTEKHPGDLDRVQKRAAAAGLSDRLRFMGRRPDAIAFIGAADVFVNPSEVEGLPIAVLEAMALATPIVATAAGGVPTIVRDHDTGILVDPGDAGALADGLKRILDDVSLAASLGEAARTLVESEYGLESMVRATEDIYRRVLDE